jgi:hypothetical protein
MICQSLPLLPPPEVKPSPLSLLTKQIFRGISGEFCFEPGNQPISIHQDMLEVRVEQGLKETQCGRCMIDVRLTRTPLEAVCLLTMAK